MLANGRPEMVKRAVAAFHAQEYRAKRLLIYNTGEENIDDAYLDSDDVAVVDTRKHPNCIGILRNAANGAALDLFPGVGCFAHWDSDDWSHPKRLVEQVDALEYTGADLVGYSDGIFWDSRTVSPVSADGTLGPARPGGEAWVYRALNPHHMLGSSMLYPRATWERTPFPSVHAGEDTLWLLALSRSKFLATPSSWSWQGLQSFEPRMIFSIHGGNTEAAIQPGKQEWKREPLWDLYCRSRMRLDV